MREKVLVVGSHRGDPARTALADLAVVSVADAYSALGMLRAEDLDVVVIADREQAQELLPMVREHAPSAQVVLVGTPEGHEPPPGVSEVVLPEHVPTVLRAAVHRALRDRGASLEAALHDRTLGVASLVDPETLGPSMAAAACAVTGAQHAAWVSRGPDGHFVVLSSAGPEGSAPPRAVLTRWTERLARERTLEPVSESRGTHHVAGAAVASPHAFHGVLWVSRATTRRSWSARELAALATLVAGARIAAEHHRLVRDLQSRLVSMEATRARLEEDARAASVGRLAVDAIVAIRDPLAYTRTNLRAAIESGEVPGGSLAARHLAYADQGLARADRAVEDLGRISQGRDRVPVEVRELVSAALALVRPLDVPETVEIAENAVVSGNPGRLAQALAELLRNAAQSPGATQVHLTATRARDTVAIEVADDGEGIPADQLSRVTEPFFSTRGRAGLGLTTAKDVFTRAGGTLEIRSRRGVGTVVRVQLPGEAIDDELELAGEPADEDGDEETDEDEDGDEDEG